jgi:hypothetical protein
VRRINAIFDIERSINGLPAAQRLAVRQERIVPLVDALGSWMREARRKMSRHADVAKSMGFSRIERLCAEASESRQRPSTA